MYAHVLQVAEERFRKKRVKTSTGETNPSSSTSAMATDDPPLIVHTLPSTSSSLMTTPSSPSSIPSTITIAATPDEMPILHIPPNPSPLAAFVAPPKNMVAEVTTNTSLLFPVSLEMSSSVSLAGPTTATSPPISSVDSDIPSISNTSHFPSSFSFALNIPPGDDTPSSAMSWSPPPSLASIPWGTDMLPSSFSPQTGTPTPHILLPLLPPLLGNPSPSSKAPAPSSPSPMDPTSSSLPSSPPSSTP